MEAHRVIHRTVYSLSVCSINKKKNLLQNVR
jgi:hypothetical protein